MMKARILVADDNPDNLYLLETLLKAHGCSVVTAVDGDDALAKLQEGGFDMILSDVLMPGMDGFQLCRECKRDDKLRTIPFVFCTATYTDGSAFKQFDSRCQGGLGKLNLADVLGGN